MHTLVAYYSMSGNTRSVARELGSAIGADIEEIGEVHPRHGVSGFARAMFDAMARRETPIVHSSRDPAQYDLLVIGGPIWAGRLATPVRSYAHTYGKAAPHVAFFCTEGGRGAEDAFADLERLCGHKPEATLVVDAAHLTPEAHRADLGRFAATVT